MFLWMIAIPFPVDLGIEADPISAVRAKGGGPMFQEMMPEVRGTTDYEMCSPKGCYPDSITYSRDRLPDSGLRVVFRHLIGNGVGNALMPSGTSLSHEGFRMP